jgi:plastocyanin
MRRLVLGAGLTLALMAVPAWGATSDVDVSGFAFTPRTVQVQPGDTVTWHFTGPDLNHSVTATAGQSESFDSDPGDSSPLHAPNDAFSHTFPAAGRFTYFCKVHPYMQGTVQVGDPGGGGEPPPGGDTTAPGVSQLEAKGGRRCRRGARKCKPAQSRIRFTLSEAARVRIALKRSKGKSPRAIERDVPAGASTVRLSAKRVPPGRYAVTVVATDAAGNASGPAKASLRVRG